MHSLPSCSGYKGKMLSSFMLCASILFLPAGWSVGGFPCHDSCVWYPTSCCSGLQLHDPKRWNDCRCCNDSDHASASRGAFHHLCHHRRCLWARTGSRGGEVPPCSRVITPQYHYKCSGSRGGEVQPCPRVITPQYHYKRTESREGEVLRCPRVIMPQYIYKRTRSRGEK